MRGVDVWQEIFSTIFSALRFKDFRGESGLVKRCSKGVAVFPFKQDGAVLAGVRVKVGVQPVPVGRVEHGRSVVRAVWTQDAAAKAIVCRRGIHGAPEAGGGKPASPIVEPAPPETAAAHNVSREHARPGVWRVPVVHRLAAVDHAKIDQAAV